MKRCDYCKKIKTSQEAYWYLSSEGKRDEVCEELIKQDPKYVYLYCMDVLKSRWVEGEDVLYRSTKYMSFYAISILKDKLPEKLHNAMTIQHTWNPDSHTKQYFSFLQTIMDRKEK
jgi:hypothetical protein